MRPVNAHTIRTAGVLEWMNYIDRPPRMRPCGERSFSETHRLEFSAKRMHSVHRREEKWMNGAGITCVERSRLFSVHIIYFAAAPDNVHEPMCWCASRRELVANDDQVTIRRITIPTHSYLHRGYLSGCVEASVAVLTKEVLRRREVGARNTPSIS